MADEEKKDDGELKPEVEERRPKKSKKALFLGGGAVSVVATAAAVVMLAVPGDEKVPHFDGPYVMDLAALEDGQALTANLAGEGGRRYLVLDLKVEFDAYSQAYGLQRVSDPLYIAKLQDCLLTVASQKSAEDVLERGTQELFIAELHEAVEPLLFPVHVGTATSPTGADPLSGLRPGLSIAESTMRDAFHETELHVDAIEKTVSMGAGEVYEFDGDEGNLMVKDELGRTVYLDVTTLKPEFEGDLNVGVKGRIRELYKAKLIIQ